MRRSGRRRRRAVVVVITMISAALAMLARSRMGRRGGWVLTRGTVRRTADGDTFTLSNGERVRLLEIDAPETGGANAEMARRSSSALAGLIGGREVRLEPGPRNRDKYDRMLAYVFVASEADGTETFVNAEIVRLGLARAKTWGTAGSRWDAILAAEKSAREAGLGLWSGTD